MTGDTSNEIAVPCSNFPDNVFGVAQILSRQFRKCPHRGYVSPHLQCSGLALPYCVDECDHPGTSRLLDQRATMLGLRSENKIGVTQCLDACNRLISNAVPQRVALPEAMPQIPRTSFLGLPGKGTVGDCCAGNASSLRALHGRESSVLASRKLQKLRSSVSAALIRGLRRPR